MATWGGRETFGSTAGGRGPSIVAVVLLVAVTGWAGSAGQTGEVEAAHPSPATVEAVEGSDFSWVTLTPDAAEKIGLDVADVEPTDHPAGGLVVAYSALVQGADGTTWVYASSGDPLRFRRQVVEVAAVDGGRAILSRGPSVGTAVAGFGSAQLYGTEFEVGH